MSKRGMDFLERWMAANVKAGGNAAELARRCIDDAMVVGITREQMEEESGPLEALIAAALAHRTNGGDVITEADD